MELKFGAAGPMEMKPTSQYARRHVAGTLLQFPASGAARRHPSDPRPAIAECVVLRLPVASASARVRARDTEPVQEAHSIRVALLRERVARGEYRIDARRVAHKLIAAHGL